jgi:branched-chain amino acid transport system substrate-binding protein
VITRATIADSKQEEDLGTQEAKAMTTFRAFSIRLLLQFFPALLSPLALTTNSRAEPSADPVVIGVISDMSGVYADFNGQGLVTAAEMAVHEMGGKVLGRPIKVLSFDPQERPENATGAVRKWIDQEHASMVMEGTTSAIAVAIQKVAQEKKTIFFAFSGTAALTNDDCSPYGIQYVWNNYAMAHGVGASETKPGDKWFFVTADYTFGKTLEAEAQKVVEAAGGKVVGSVRHPLGVADFSSYLLQAQTAGANVVGLADAGRDTQNAIRQAAEFGLQNSGVRIQPLVLFDTDIRGIGLQTAQKLQYLTGFYWDRDEKSRAWSHAFFDLQKSMPTMNQAGAYSATLNFLKAVEKAGTLDADKVRAALKETPVSDAFTQTGIVRDNGSMAHDMFLMEIKSPAESKDKWDIARVVRTLPAAEIFQPLETSTCKFLTR